LKSNVQRQHTQTDFEHWTLDIGHFCLEPLTGLEPALINVRSVAPFH
jgi:hypothetical protein